MTQNRLEKILKNNEKNRSIFNKYIYNDQTNKLVEVLVSAINLKGFQHIYNMNVETHGFVCNQLIDIEGETKLEVQGKLKMLTTKTQGVGLSRNTLLAYSQAKYCVLADDDMIFLPDLERKVIENFEKHPSADVLIFNLDSEEEMYKIDIPFRVRRHNFMRFGAARIVFKRQSILKNSIFFNQFFGGGSIYSSGEDTLFLSKCLENDLKIIAVPETLAILTKQRESTWFVGYNLDYFTDKGALFAAMSRRFYKVYILQFVVRKKSLFQGNISYAQLYKAMIKGARSFFEI